jgi:hypothetical protein
MDFGFSHKTFFYRWNDPDSFLQEPDIDSEDWENGQSA